MKTISLTRRTTATFRCSSSTWSRVHLVQLTGPMSQWIQTKWRDLGALPLDCIPSVAHMHSVLERVAIDKWSLFLKCEMIILDHWQGSSGDPFSRFVMCKQLEVQEQCSPHNDSLIFNFFFFFAHTGEVQRPECLNAPSAHPVCSSPRSLLTWI